MNNWTRKELKEKAKVSFKANYWKCVLAALLLALFTGGVTHGSFSSGAAKGFDDRHNNSSYSITEEKLQEITNDQDAADEFFNNLDEESQSEASSLDQKAQSALDDFGMDSLSFAALLGVLFVILLVLLLIGLAITVFLGNPLAVGLRKFFIDNAGEKSKLGAIMNNFDNGYKNTVKAIFLMQLKLFGWFLLLIIPGIIKAYEYRMIPYLLADNPKMDRKEAHELSKSMMMGNKWKTFVLDLSFIGWFILSALTLGILAIFYVNPYYYQTDANLYHALKGVQPAAPAEPVEEAAEAEISIAD